MDKKRAKKSQPQGIVFILTFLFCTFPEFQAFADILSVWLTQGEEANRVVVNWRSEKSGIGTVYWGKDSKRLTEKYSSGTNYPSALHQIPLHSLDPDTRYFYSVETKKGDTAYRSPIYSFKSMPSESKQLRIAVYSNMGYLKTEFQDQLKNILLSDPHLLISCGDNVPSLHLGRTDISREDLTAFYQMLDRCPELFRSIPLLSCAGNHDKEIRSRGKQRPKIEDSRYDVPAVAFLKFFRPYGQKVWKLSLPERNIVLVGLDLCHLNDMGTGWQACAPFDSESLQFAWYEKMVRERPERYFITFYNASSWDIRHHCDGIWEKEFRQGSLCISGCGYFTEMARLEDGTPYINTSLNVGKHYKDRRHARFSEPVSSFTLLRFEPNREVYADLLNLQDRTNLYSFQLKPREIHP